MDRVGPGGVGTGAPVTDLQELLAGMRPEVHQGEYVFCALPPGAPVPAGVRPAATVVEREGLTVVLPTSEAEAAGLTGGLRLVWITLTVRSSLAAVGLTAAVAGALAEVGIACNVIAGFHHDHLFVPVGAASDAMAALHAVARLAGQAAPFQATGAPGLVEP